MCGVHANQTNALGNDADSPDPEELKNLDVTVTVVEGGEPYTAGHVCFDDTLRDLQEQCKAATVEQRTVQGTSICFSCDNRGATLRRIPALDVLDPLLGSLLNLDQIDMTGFSLVDNSPPLQTPLRQDMRVGTLEFREMTVGGPPEFKYDAFINTLSRFIEVDTVRFTDPPPQLFGFDNLEYRRSSVASLLTATKVKSFELIITSRMDGAEAAIDVLFYGALLAIASEKRGTGTPTRVSAEFNCKKYILWPRAERDLCFFHETLNSGETLRSTTSQYMHLLARLHSWEKDGEYYPHAVHGWYTHLRCDVVILPFLGITETATAGSHDDHEAVS